MTKKHPMASKSESHSEHRVPEEASSSSVQETTAVRVPSPKGFEDVVPSPLVHEIRGVQYGIVEKLEGGALKLKALLGTSSPFFYYPELHGHKALERKPDGSFVGKKGGFPGQPRGKSNSQPKSDEQEEEYALDRDATSLLAEYGMLVGRPFEKSELINESVKGWLKPKVEDLKRRKAVIDSLPDELLTKLSGTSESTRLRILELIRKEQADG